MFSPFSPDSPLSPISPYSPETSSVRREMMSLPPIAIVHKATLDKVQSYNYNGGPSRHDLSEAASTTRMPRTPNSTRSCVLLGRAFEQIDVKVYPAVGEGDRVRMLSKTEVRQRSKEAISYFRNTRQINKQSLTLREMDAMIEAAKYRKELRSAQQQRERLFQDVHADEIQTPTQDQEKDSKPQKRSLADRMGYGVKPKTDPSTGLSSIKHIQMVRRTNMIGVKAGENDLLQRLAARRHRTIE
jgi:hypothetical protein